jgi:signal peptidase I
VSRLPDPWRKLADWLITLGFAVGFILTFEAEVAKPYRIPSSSMERTLHCARPGAGCRAATSDRVLVNRLAYDFSSPQRGQIVVFTAPAGANRCESGDAGKTFVKRLIGMPGETVRENAHGFILVRGSGVAAWTRLAEPYVSRQSRLADTRHFDHTWRVPRSEYFMLGDNRGDSCDSRDWGPVPRSSLIGPVIFTYWPPGRVSYHPGGW